MRHSTLRKQKAYVQIFDETSSGSYSATGDRPSGVASAVSRAKQSVVSRSMNVFDALRRRPYLHV